MPMVDDFPRNRRPRSANPSIGTGVGTAGLRALRDACRKLSGASLICGLAALAGCSGRPSADYYDTLEVMLRATGKLRTETTAADAPYDAASLARDFERVALYKEADVMQPGGEGNREARPLRRWARPLRYGLFGSAVTEADRAEVTDIMGRISALTGLEAREVDEDVNFIILITTPGERTDFVRELAEINVSVSETFDRWRRTSNLICFGSILLDGRASGKIIGAVVSIGSETRNLMRQSCLHEEIAQSMGLTNDHPGVRPSIFNDDEEFALLTGHDEALMRILYDARLEAGMTAAEAMPVVRVIAGELAPEPAPPGPAVTN